MAFDRGGNPMHRPVKLVNPKAKKPPAKKPGKRPSGIGFDPKTMAKTMTDLAYGTDIAQIERSIVQSQAQEDEALKDLQSWASQIEDQRAYGASQATAAWDQGIAQAQQGQSNINDLFGGAGGVEGASYGQAGIDMLSGLGASDKAFDARMAPILGAQSLDARRRASGEFNSQQKELQGSLRDTQKEKGLAYQKNLLDAMDMAWGRKQDILQYQTGQESLKQAKILGQQAITRGKQDITQGGQAIAGNKVQLQQQQVALKSSVVALKKAQMEAAAGPEGAVDWNNPATRSNIGNAAFSGTMSPRNTFSVSPKVALQNAMDALKQMGLANDPRAVEAVKVAFGQILRLSHARNQWKKWKINLKGHLIFDPAGKPVVVAKSNPGKNPDGTPKAGSQAEKDAENSSGGYGIGDIFGGLRNVGR